MPVIASSVLSALMRSLLGKSLINPRVIGLTDELDEIVKRENIDRIVVAMGERRGQLPTNKLLQLSLAGEVTIEEGASFYERITGRVSLNMLRPSWLIFTGRGRQAKHRRTFRATRCTGWWRLIGAILSLPIVLVTADSDQARVARSGFLQAGTSRKKRPHVCA